MIRGLVDFLFPPLTSRPDPRIADEEISAQVRKAQQRLASSSRQVAAGAKRDAVAARSTAASIRIRIEEKQAVLAAAESALEVLRGQGVPE